MAMRQEVLAKLVATKKWSEQAVLLGERADYRCEYCGLDLLHSEETYKLWQRDHIIPLSQHGGREDIENLALSCKTCNWDWKGRWEPTTAAGEDASRGALIAAVREYIKERKHRTRKDLDEVKEITGIGERDLYPPD